MKSTVKFLVIGAIAGGLVCLAVAVFGCKATGQVVATVKDCANEVTHQVALGIVDDVSAVLICDKGNASQLPACVVAQLGEIAKKAGWVAIDCAIAEIQHQAVANLSAESSADPTELIRLRRANAVAAWRAHGDAGLP